MASLIAHLTPLEQQQLLDDLNYLNLEELHRFCREHSIPYTIYVEDRQGELRKTRDNDRKSVVLERVRHFLQQGEIPPPTRFVAAVVSDESFSIEPRASDRLYYGRYDKKHRGFLERMHELTDGKFRNGAIARILAREFWTSGKAPTLKEFAAAWVVAAERGLGYHPEAAWLTDRARGEGHGDWKGKRVAIASRALTQLKKIRPR